jgi:hypothetical protein
MSATRFLRSNLGEIPEVSRSTITRSPVVRGQLIAIALSVESLRKWCFYNDLQRACVAVGPGSKPARVEKPPLKNFPVLKSFGVVSSVVFVGQGCFLECDFLSALGFEAPLRVSELLNLPCTRESVVDISDSVTKFPVVDIKPVRKPTVSFGPTRASNRSQLGWSATQR